MKRSYFVITGVLLIWASFQGCRTDTDLTPYPAVDFDQEVLPIISGNCGQRGCHGVESPEKFSLVDYDQIMVHVTAGDARKSNLYKVITGRGEEFMPPSPSSPLTESQIATIFLWIEQGAPNN
jgi:hypothetical protein